MPRDQDDGVVLEIEDVKVETEKAYLVVIEGDEYWLPKSQIVDEGDITGKGDSGELTVTTWWANKEGLE